MQNFKKTLLIIFSILTLFLSLFSKTDSLLTSFPTDYTNISSDYGNRYLFDDYFFHNGIDFLAPQNSKVYSFQSGVIQEIGFSNSYGNYIKILHSNHLISLYGHLDEIFFVHAGDYVSNGEYIGNVGPKYLSNGVLNGITTGPHLHFTIFDMQGNTLNPHLFLPKKE